MDKTKDSGTWLKFFKDAGIPTKTGASYAHIFVENRITKDMLSDLTVDHLRLMGVTLMGDVIAILRHAKSVHQDSLRKVVILKSKDDESESSSSSSSSSSDSSSSSSDSDDDVEMLEHFKKEDKFVWSETKNALQSKVKKEPTSKAEEPRKIVKSKVITNTTTPSTSKINSGVGRKTLAQHLKRKHIEVEQTTDVDDYSLLKKRVGKETNSSSGSGRSILHRLQETAESESPVKKSSESQFMGPKLPPPKKTVFDRLGAESNSPQVSSTTEVAKPEMETRFTRTIGNVSLPTEKVKIVANIDIPPPKPSSVFNRLGEMTQQPVSGASLPYAGVLKATPMVTRPLMNGAKKILTMRADQPEVPVKLRATKKPSIERNIKLRVGEISVRANQRPKLIRNRLTNGRFVNPDSEGIFANPKNAIQLSAKDRIGLSRQNVLNKSAKARLGLQTNSGRITPTSQILQRFRKPVQVKTQYTNVDNFKLTSRNGAVNKKVSFGGVVQRYITPMRVTHGGGNVKTGIHSRLGRGRFN